jgi:hypothetical protein
MLVDIVLTMRESIHSEETNRRKARVGFEIALGTTAAHAYIQEQELCAALPGPFLGEAGHSLGQGLIARLTQPIRRVAGLHAKGQAHEGH